MKPSFKDRQPPTDSEIREYFQILKQDSKSRVFAALAEGLIRRGRLGEAEAICQLGLEANPEFSDGHLAYARVLFYLFRYKEALEAIKVTLGLDKDNLEAYLIAAEIFTARSQHKAASEACLKAIDLDPENQQARLILKRIGAGQQKPKEGDRKPEPARGSTDSFKATAGTAPGRRAIKLSDKPSLSDPFRQLLHEAGQQASDQLEKDDQPFSALSSGSHPPVPPDLFDQDLDVPTKRELKPKRPDGTPIPRLPERPPPPEMPTAEAPPPGSAASALPQVVDSSGMLLVDRVQAVIDSYADRIATDPQDRQSLPRVPRAFRILTLLALLAMLVAIGLAIVYGLRSEVRRQTAETTESARAGASLLLTDQSPILPVPEPAPPPEPPAEPLAEEAAVTPPPEAPPPEEEAAPVEKEEEKKAEPVKNAKKKRKAPRRRKKPGRRRTRR